MRLLPLKRLRRGFSLAEVIVAMMVFALLATGIVKMMDYSFRETYRLTDTNDPLRDVQLYLEQLRVKPLSEFASLGGVVELYNKEGNLEAIPLNSWYTVTRMAEEVPLEMRIDVQLNPGPPNDKGDPPVVAVGDPPPYIEIIIDYRWTPKLSSVKSKAPEVENKQMRIVRSYVVRY